MYNSNGGYGPSSLLIHKNLDASSQPDEGMLVMEGRVR